MKPHTFIAIWLSFSLNALISQTVPNGSFETWVTTAENNYENPEKWKSSNNVCEPRGLAPNVWRTAESYAGAYALKLETGRGLNGEPILGSVYCNAALRERPFTLKGYFKANLKTDDMAGIVIYLKSNNTVIGYSDFIIYTSTNYFTPFEIPIHYYNPVIVPDSMFISIHSSIGVASPGTNLIVDELSLESPEVAYTFPTPKTILRPNPATDELLVEIPESLGLITFRIFDNSGRMMKSEDFMVQERFDVSGYTPGMYFYEVRKMNHDLYDSGRFVVTCTKQ